ncbi:TetR/AcrR family transcriptional regulator [Streptomyces vietnamensis]|uniref:TetR family transcriptional regulator n=1 Tax=Streptomyces vietnamensis TaxID=362257 RepID=A0A0B5I0R7_9ACTN|nr:TetR/AcrR family transcriptional regulator [Streptomyces vietnamensis]AJF67740.1 TetR family transcriptional regulator [Streptomyces vietnamensis]
MPRADAVRNRRLLMDAAAAEFAENGMDVSITRIATRAGVGKGTVFRHFDTKEQLLAEVFSDRLEELVAVGRRLTEADDAEAALFEFMTTGVEIHVRDRSFCQAAAALSPSEASVRASRERVAEVADTLVDRAREAGAVRDDVTGLDIVLLLSAAAQAVLSIDEDPQGSLWQRYLALIIDGLRPQGAHPLPVPAPTLGRFTG